MAKDHDERRMVRTIDRTTGAESEWTPLDDKEQELMLNAQDMLIQTLAYEAGGTYVVSRERFERAVRGIMALGDDVVPQMGVSRDHIIIELVHADTEEPIKVNRA